MIAVSVDLDAPIDYFRFYRVAEAPPSGPFLADSLSRLGELFARLGLRATFFAIGRDAAEPEAARALRQLVEAGHEVANHTLSHPIAFRELARAEKAREVAEGRERLEQAVSAPVRGFRCPAYDVDRELLEVLLEQGYAYDSSLMPTPFLVPMRWLIQARSRRRAVGLGELSHAWSRRAPHCLHRGRGGRLVVGEPPAGEPFLVELPLSVVSPLRLPFYGTITQAYGERFFAFALRRLRREALPINYALHAAEVSAFDPAARGAECARVPGYGRPLEERRALLASTLGRLAEGAASVTLGELAARLRGEVAARPARAEGAEERTA
ncbi:MAG: polysaccharide deacetylase family protein [Thermoanaerobaculia bacterium]